METTIVDQPVIDSIKESKNVYVACSPGMDKEFVRVHHDSIVSILEGPQYFEEKEILIDFDGNDVYIG